MTQFKTAFIRGQRIFRNLFIDLRFGKILGGTYLKPVKSDNSDYEALSRIFEDRILPDDVLVDIGCGNGRVINWWLRHHPTHLMFGIELEPEIGADTQKRLKKYANVNIIIGNAIQNLPQNGSLFYFYNPFPSEIVSQLIKQVAKQFKPENKIRLFYYNCKYIDLFESDPNWHVDHINIGGALSAPWDPLAILTLI